MLHDERTAVGHDWKNDLWGDLTGGLAAVLVALPSAVAFGLIVFGHLGGEFVAEGATAGIVGTVLLGLVAPLLGGTPRLITAPCAPAAAVLGEFTTTLAGRPGSQALALLSIVILGAGALQLLFGISRGGRLVKFIPYPVVAGYLSSVGILIVVQQLPKLLGLTPDGSLWKGLLAPQSWNPAGLVVGLAAIVFMIGTSQVTQKVPAPIVALAGSTVVCFLCAAFQPDLLALDGNALVIGRLEGGISGLESHLDSLWHAMGSLPADALGLALASAGTLAVLLSIDTLKTCVIVDAMTTSRHDSNREIIGQGAANLAAGLGGGIAGAGTMGATLINLASGGRTRLSGLFVGFFALAVFALFRPLIAWVPVPALAGILVVIGFRMIDRSSLKLVRQRSTAFDFLVMLAVVVKTIAINLIAAAGVGIALAVLLFVREHVRTSVVRRRFRAAGISSKKKRLPAEMEILRRRGAQTVIFELQGSLFFGTTDQLMTEIEPHLARARYIVLDLRRVLAVDFSAARMLEALAGRLGRRRGHLVLTHPQRPLPTGQNLAEYFVATGVVGGTHAALIFSDVDSALAALEDCVLDEERAGQSREDRPLGLSEIEISAELSSEMRALLAQCAVEKSFKAGEVVFRLGDGGDTFHVIRRGSVRIVFPLPSQKACPTTSRPSGGETSSGTWPSSTAARARRTPSAYRIRTSTKSPGAPSTMFRNRSPGSACTFSRRWRVCSRSGCAMRTPNCIRWRRLKKTCARQPVSGWQVGHTRVTACNPPRSRAGAAEVTRWLADPRRLGSHLRVHHVTRGADRIAARALKVLQQVLQERLQ
jgi:SulP family sulfate permease